ncbi:uncharacterized protein [Physcomitrium patens]|uniref:uncharacterized protein isoform X1 n=2 Tax=Physcomitrium patens TaxID=3218 RepID=UPI000D17A865|nr:uncharacterized protein LOC112275134 isoform X2 [Physcomitrium patens]|eukprot:XP_024360963.1 uncharacterized protein LOC112275134 isoform X2 [Physcomitrella patens]
MGVGVTRRQGRDELDEALDEIKNVLWIMGTEVSHQSCCKEALEVWQEKEALFTSRNDRRRKQISYCQTEIYQLVGFYSVFQGVLFTAVAQSTNLKCNNRWTVILLSALASVVIVIGVFLKLKSIKEFKDLIYDDEVFRRVQVLVKWILRLKETGEKFVFKVDEPSEVFKTTPFELNASFLTVILALVSLSVVFPVTFDRILCNSNK